MGACHKPTLLPSRCLAKGQPAAHLQPRLLGQGAAHLRGRRARRSSCSRRTSPSSTPAALPTARDRRSSRVCHSLAAVTGSSCLERRGPLHQAGRPGSCHTPTLARRRRADCCRGVWLNNSTAKTLAALPAALSAGLLSSLAELLGRFRDGPFCRWRLVAGIRRQVFLDKVQQLSLALLRVALLAVL